MKIETIIKHNLLDYQILKNDYCSTKNLILTKEDFNNLFMSDNALQSIRQVFYDNMYSYNDQFVNAMTDFFNANCKNKEAYIELLQNEIKNISTKLDNCKRILEELQCIL